MPIQQNSNSSNNDQRTVDVYRKLFESGLEMIRENKLPDEIILEILREYDDKIKTQFEDRLKPELTRKISPVVLLAAQEKLLTENQDLINIKSGYEEILNLLTHEYKNLLTTVHGYNLIMEKRLHEEGADDLLELQNSGDRVIKKMFNLTNTILKMSLGEKGLLTPDYRLLDFCSDILDPLEKELNNEFSLKSMTLNRKIKAKKTMIVADEQLIEIIMRNLLENAAKYGDADSRVDLLIENDNNRLSVSIKNACRYIPDNICDKIFEKFNSIKLSSIKSGTGIGLYIVRMLLRLHDGDIFCSSVPNKWIKFKFNIPYEPEVGKI